MNFRGVLNALLPYCLIKRFAGFDAYRDNIKTDSNKAMPCVHTKGKRRSVICFGGVFCRLLFLADMPKGVLEVT